MTETSQRGRVRAIAVLDDPIRRQLYEFVSRSSEPVGRDEAANFARLPRTTAAFHLDRLVEAGLLAVEFSKRTGRDGPGSGRPSKLYVRVADEVSATVPERHYDLMGNVLASAIETADASGTPVRNTLSASARERGRALGSSATGFLELIESIGYEPEASDNGTVTLTNCPFHRLAASHTEVICQANVALLEGAAEGCGDRKHRVNFDPASGRCCVTLTRR